jgi:hypothetical protein
MKTRFIFFLFSFLIANSIFGQASSEVDQMIQRDIDPQTGEITIANSYLDNVQFSKWMLKKKTAYYLSLYVEKDTVMKDQKGVIVFFDDGSKWERVNEKIEQKENSSEFSVFIELSDKDLRLFSTKKITKFRLWKFESEIQKSFAEQFLLMVNAIIKMEK